MKTILPIRFASVLFVYTLLALSLTANAQEVRGSSHDSLDWGTQAIAPPVADHIGRDALGFPECQDSQNHALPPKDCLTLHGAAADKFNRGCLNIPHEINAEAKKFLKTMSHEGRVSGVSRESDDNAIISQCGGPVTVSYTFLLTRGGASKTCHFSVSQNGYGTHVGGLSDCDGKIIN